MNRLLYESSVAYKGYLIIPFVFGKVDDYEIYSYKLLAEVGHKSRFHGSENPAAMYSNTVTNIVDIAKEHIDLNMDFVSQGDFFQSRYVYRHNLIIVYQRNSRCYYDHYAPDSLTNIAAPKLFSSPYECLNWVQQGLDGRKRA
ncbi:hypothetical protein [Aphanizomenon sp. UHCC 0183]|uniref:hypothetical protein n=1 Tax=Aphanizomenon sp. UHCC 0183 TaxID=2590028 RepID=UPI001445AB23|nr:hypothetical protein [Aphanizomenon sp. UHCC 0183]MTJ28842.1 hypothetical protein [Aphanizomenon sp. UHCC 0183]QSV72243.1 MAG: hypothetical protein HEQ20_17695 [Aphanizomenon flos-aquae KM1D3_PB]